MTTTDRRFERPISATERLYLASQSPATPFVIQLVVTGRGEIDPDELAAAVAKASSACPGARLRQHGGRWIDSGSCPNVVVVDGEGIDDAAIDDDPVLTSELGAGGRSAAEVVLVRGTGTATVVFRVFHGVMDAGGVRLWMADIFRALRGEDPIGASDPSADHDVVARLGTSHQPTTLRPVKRSPLGATGPAPLGQRFLRQHRIVAATAPGAVARIAVVLADAIGTSARIMIPIDLRRHDPGLRSTANLALPLFLDVDPGETWASVHARMLIQMSESRELSEMNNGGLARFPMGLARAILRGLSWLGARTDRNMVSAIVSHFGTVNTAEFSANGFVATQVRAIPGHQGVAPLLLVVLECDGKTEITVSCRAGAGVNDRLTALLDQVAGTLTPAADPPADRPLEPAARGGHATTSPAISTDALFRERVRAAPDTIAVQSPETELTYRELDRRADAIAAALQAHGVAHGHLVAILAGRTVHGIAGQLGILRAGAAFVPLDPNHPPQRLASVLADSGAAALLVERAHVGVIGAELTTLVLDELPESAGTPVQVPTTGDDLAYVVYTSGSTGRPKGILVRHRGVVQFVATATDWYSLGPHTRFAHHHPPTFDLSCVAFFGALLTGGAIILIPEEISHVSLRRMLCESGANTFLFTPSVLGVVTRLGIDPPVPRVVVSVGEALSPDLAARARQLFGPGTRLVNSYGPSEMTMMNVSHILAENPDSAAKTVPIGSPAAGTDAYLLNPTLQPVADGEIGELFFSGPQVACGYLNRPDLTTEKFIVLPGGIRGYRTGDLARRLPDGQLDFVGRIDDQIKIRGNRVEPAEVRAVLEQFPGIDHAAVVARTGPHEATLAGYAVTPDGLDDGAVRAFLSERLPAYMVPAVICAVDELPLTPNGKLDVSRLPGGAPPDPTGSVDASAPNDPELERIAHIWAEILLTDTATVTPDTDFYALGGNSLTSIEMLARVSRDIVGPEGEARFIAGLEGLIQRMTLAHVHAAATAARASAS